MLLFTCVESADMLTLPGLADDFGFREAEGLALGELLLHGLTLADLLGHYAHHLHLAAVAGEQGGLSLLACIDPLDGCDCLTNLM